MSAHRRRCRGSTALPLLVLLSLGACTGEARPEPATPDPDLSFSVSQYRSDEHTARANLRVINHDEETPVVVSETGLDWEGYGDPFSEPQDATVLPGQALDLRMTFPEPACDVTDPVPARGTAVVSGRRVTLELEEAGQSFLESLWRRACNAAAVEAVADISLGDRWRQVGEGGSATYAGDIVVRRTGSRGTALEVTGLEGSILFALEADPPFVLRPGQGRLLVPVSLSPFRCDPHARGEATQAFLFRLDVTVGSGPSRRITVAGDDPAWQGAAMDYLDRTCG